MKLNNHKGKVVLIITVAAASVVGGSIRALGALGTKLGLEDAPVDRLQQHRRGVGRR